MHIVDLLLPIVKRKLGTQTIIFKISISSNRLYTEVILVVASHVVLFSTNLTLIPAPFLRKIRWMRKPILKIGLFVTALCLVGVTSVATPSTNRHRWRFSDLFSSNQNIWNYMSHHFQLDSRYYNHTAVKNQVHKLKNQQSYIYELTRNAQPYIYYVLQQTRKRGMPDEIALIPMVESNYNPFGDSYVGATGLWQLMPDTASGF